jgi:sulfatase maturation enzyme AslB (radical SAM superfamily)
MFSSLVEYKRLQGAIFFYVCYNIVYIYGGDTMALVKPNYHFINGFVHENKFNPIQVDNGIITINYLLSSKCQLNCGYCIAKDIIKNYRMPSLEQVDNAIDTILELDPLVTVLTGGEPMLSPYLEHVIERLYGHTNIMLDTNGLLLLNSDLKFFGDHHVAIRISVDILGRKNCLVRPALTNDSRQRGGGTALRRRCRAHAFA